MGWRGVRVFQHVYTIIHRIRTKTYICMYIGDIVLELLLLLPLSLVSTCKHTMEIFNVATFALTHSLVRSFARCLCFRERAKDAHAPSTFIYLSLYSILKRRINCRVNKDLKGGTRKYLTCENFSTIRMFGVKQLHACMHRLI